MQLFCQSLHRTRTATPNTSHRTRPTSHTPHEPHTDTPTNTAARRRAWCVTAHGAQPLREGTRHVRSPRSLTRAETREAGPGSTHGSGQEQGTWTAKQGLPREGEHGQCGGLNCRPTRVSVRRGPGVGRHPMARDWGAMASGRGGAAGVHNASVVAHPAGRRQSSSSRAATRDRAPSPLTPASHPSPTFGRGGPRHKRPQECMHSLCSRAAAQGQRDRLTALCALRHVCVDGTSRCDGTSHTSQNVRRRHGLRGQATWPV